MDSLYKYIPKEFADIFVREGKVLFRSLSYFRDYEDKQIRGDEFEGTRRYAPESGITINVKGESGPRVIPCAFESTAREADIFVLCLSTEFDKSLAERFNVDTCIEIFDPARFISKIGTAIPPRYKIVPKHLVRGLVNYYDEGESPIVDWALPEKIAMGKPKAFAWQKEYRLVFPVKNAFKVEDVTVRLVPLGEKRKLISVAHSNYNLTLGPLFKCCRIKMLT